MKPASTAAVSIAPLVLAACLPSPTHAGELTSVGVEFSRIERTIQIAASPVETRVNAVGARIGERLFPGLTLEMPIGHAELVQPGNPATAGRRPGGGYLGVGARWQAEAAERVLFLGRVEYSYYRFDSPQDADGGNYEIDWYRTSLHTGIGIDGGVWSTAVGAGAEWLEGDETVPSATRTNRVKGDGAGFGWLRAGLRTGRAETLIVRIEAGDRRGVWLSFRKGF